MLAKKCDCVFEDTESAMVKAMCGLNLIRSKSYWFYGGGFS